MSEWVSERAHTASKWLTDWLKWAPKDIVLLSLSLSFFTCLRNNTVWCQAIVSTWFSFLKSSFLLLFTTFFPFAVFCKTPLMLRIKKVVMMTATESKRRERKQFSIKRELRCAENWLARSQQLKGAPNVCCTLPSNCSNALRYWYWTKNRIARL